MARPQSQRNLMYVPTPDPVIDWLRERLDIPGDVIALDPCCGSGAALRRLCPESKRLYGVELERDRAEAATEHIDIVARGALQDMRISHNRFGLMLLNPPYDDSTEGRLERVFLDRATSYLIPGGVLVYIVPERQYYAPWLVQFIARHYERIEHHYFPPDEFKAYSQTVLIGFRRAAPVEPMRETDARQACGIPYMRHGELPTVVNRTPVPRGQRPDIFKPASLDKEACSAMLARSPVPRMPFVPQLSGGRPPRPLATGHLALVLASGQINGVYGSGADRHVAKGTVMRQEHKDERSDTTRNGNPVLISRIVHTFAVVVRVMLGDGTIKDISGGAVIADDAEIEDA